MKAPFIWFGGKRRVAHHVWDALGDVDSYAEPFAGSLAVLLERPEWHAGRTETVNDKDHYLANFWRALAADPDTVAHYADWPVNETDLFARHLWLVNTGRTILAANLEAAPDWYDPKIAGWWVWGINSWIGSGWCSGTGPWTADHTGRGHRAGIEPGIKAQRPHLGTSGQGVNRKLPHLADAGRGTSQPDGPDAFRSGGPGAPAVEWDQTDWCTDGEPALYGYMRALAARLRRVRVCAGDWSRIVTAGALNYGDTVGVFLDPPYSGEVRTRNLYATDDHDIAGAVRQWCLANGTNPRYRIVLAGYEPEHEAHMPASWRRIVYSAGKAYGPGTSSGANCTNRHLERLWLSPACQQPEPTLFDVAAVPRTVDTIAGGRL